MYWVATYFLIGWLCLFGGIWQYRATGLSLGVGIVLLLLWPIPMVKAVTEIWKERNE